MRLHSIAIGLCLTTLLLGCPDNTTQTTCVPACALGDICDQETRVCVPARIERFEGELPGRYAQVIAVQNTVFYAGIEEQTNRIVAGTLTETDHNAVILATIPRPRQLRMATEGSRVVIAWFGADGRIATATRTLDSERWAFEVADSAVPPSSFAQFDIALFQNELLIAFQATDRTLRLLRKSSFASPGDATWRLEDVDDGRDADNGFSCPETLRRTRTPGGVGVSPRLLPGAPNMLIAYLDDDCGDLRLAQRFDDGWTIDVVDPGAAESTDSRGRIGPHIDIARAPNNQVGIAYHDEGMSALKYATLVERGYAIGIPDAGYTLDQLARETKIVVGLFPSLHFTNRNEPMIAYTDGSQGRVRITEKPEGATEWTSRTVFSTPPVGWWTRIAETSSGRVISSARFVPSASGEGVTTTLELKWE